MTPDEQTVERVAKAIKKGRIEAGRDCYFHQARLAIAAMQPTPQEAAKVSDTELLDALAANYWDLKCIDIPTGGGDADVDWIIVEHHMGKKGDVTIAQAYTDDPRAALRRAISEKTQ